MKLSWLPAFTFLISNSTATNCNGLPSNNTVNNFLNAEVTNGGGEGGGTSSIRGGPYYMCQAQGTTKGTYQELSVIMEYTSASIDRVGQFEMICQASPDGWSRRSDSLTVLSSGPDVTYDGSIGLRTDCSSCINTAGNDNNCVACHSSCNDGLMRCTGSTSDDCCVAFEEDGMCKIDLNCTENNFIADTENDFTCACELSCSDGYSLNSTSCTCTLTDICVADNPCNNNGSCVLGSSPDQYTCNCTGTGYYTGTNCSYCSLICQSGYVTKTDCTECVLVDICVADNPCNGGVCILDTTPDQYTCNCTGTGYNGTKCSVCSLNCNSGTPSSDCSSCNCGMMYTGLNCETELDYCNGVDCSGHGTCSNDYVNMVAECNCYDGWAGSSCDQCDIDNCRECVLNGQQADCGSCIEGYASSGSSCVPQDVCPCCNNGICTSTQDGSYRCNCSRLWTGDNCTECVEGYGKQDNGTFTYCRNLSEVNESSGHNVGIYLGAACGLTVMILLITVSSIVMITRYVNTKKTTNRKVTAIYDSVIPHARVHTDRSTAAVHHITEDVTYSRVGLDSITYSSVGLNETSISTVPVTSPTYSRVELDNISAAYTYSSVGLDGETSTVPDTSNTDDATYSRVELDSTGSVLTVTDDAAYNSVGHGNINTVPVTDNVAYAGLHDVSLKPCPVATADENVYQYI